MDYKELDELMDFGRTIHVHEDGSVTTDGPDCGEVLVLDIDGDGGADDPTPYDVQMYLGRGWSLLSGFTGQYGYNGPIMHSSEFIGGRLADYILTVPGYYCNVVVDAYPISEDAESENVGWAVAYHPADG
jgi:hypothetical protein